MLCIEHFHRCQKLGRLVEQTSCCREEALLEEIVKPEIG